MRHYSGGFCSSDLRGAVSCFRDPTLSNGGVAEVIDDKTGRLLSRTLATSCLSSAVS